MTTTLEIRTRDRAKDVRLVKIECRGRGPCPAELIEQVYLRGEEFGAAGVPCVLVVNGERLMTW